MEIRGKHDEHRDKSEPVTKFFIKNNICLVSYKLPFYRKEGKLWRSVASGIKFRLVDWLFRMGVVGPGSLRDSRKFRYFRIFSLGSR